MARKRHEREERFLKGILPWLSRQLDDELKWLGRPEDPHYVSMCKGAKSLRRPLDAEIAGERLRVALEHTTLESFPKQRRFGALFAKLSREIRSLKPLVPPGNNVHVGLSLASVDKTLTARTVRRLMPEVIRRLRACLQNVPANPTRDDIVRGHLLEEPQQWAFEGFTVKVARFWLPGSSHISLVSLVDNEAWDNGISDCLCRAVSEKTQRKAESYKAYRNAGWLCVLVLQIVDWQLSSPDIVGPVFRQVADQFNLGCVDGVALVQELDATDQTPECCWAYFQGEVRTARQQYVEVCECLGIEPNPW